MTSNTRCTQVAGHVHLLLAALQRCALKVPACDKVCLFGLRGKYIECKMIWKCAKKSKYSKLQNEQHKYTRIVIYMQVQALLLSYARACFYCRVVVCTVVYAQYAVDWRMPNGLPFGAYNRTRTRQRRRFELPLTGAKGSSRTLNAAKHSYAYYLYIYIYIRIYFSVPVYWCVAVSK